MFTNLKLSRPLAFVDLETTGTVVADARVVEIAVLRFDPPAGHCWFCSRLNPGEPIPAEATRVHGIKDADVAHAQKFADIAANLAELLDGCDLSGFNIRRYDLRVLMHEFDRAGMTFDLDGRHLVDALEIFHEHEPRNLRAAVRLYLGREHDGAHGAEADVSVTAEVLDAMLSRYPGLPKTVRELHDRYADPAAVDLAGCFKRVGGEVRFAFGKYAGQSLRRIAQLCPEYCRWMLDGDFLPDTKAVVRKHASR